MTGRTFVGLPSTNLGRAGAGGHPCQGLYHSPRGERPRVAFVATHYSVDFSEHYLAERLVARGFGYLGWNTRFRGAESHFVLDAALVDIGVGVRWLRDVAGVETVVLVGNSGGGSLMAAYQSQAVEPNVGPAPGLSPAPGIDELVPGDLFVAVAAHLGRPDVLTAWMDAAVADEADPVARLAELDLWNPDNGPPYPPGFVARYRRAQVERNERITAWVRAEMDRLAAHGIHDRAFTTFGTWADPRMVDPTLEPTNRLPNRCYLGDPRRANASVWGIAQTSTLRTWLSMWSLTESQCRAEPHLGRVTVPTLVVNADADTGVFPSDAARLFEAVAAPDKTLVELAGDHYFREPAGARDTLADLVASWVGERE